MPPLSPEGNPDGSHDETPVEGLPQSSPEPQGQPEAFLEWEAPDKEVMRFSSPDELKSYLRDSTLRQRDYTTKTQSLAKERDSLTQRDKVLSDREAKIKELEEKQTAFRNFYKQRPDLFQQISRQVQAPASPDDVFTRVQQLLDEKLGELGKRFDDLESWRKDQEFQSQKRGYFNKLAQEFPDFDQKKIEEEMDRISGDPLALLRTVVRSMHGSEDALRAQELAAAEAREKEKARGIAGGKGRKPGPVGPITIQQAREAAQKEIENE